MYFAYYPSVQLMALCLVAFLYSCEVEPRLEIEDAEPELLNMEPAGLTEVAAPEEPKEPVYDNFGFDADSFHVEQRNVRRNENLSIILQGYNISHARIHNISQASQGVYNLRRIAAGRPVHFYTSADSLQELRYMVYERDPVHYVIFKLDAPYTVALGEKEVTMEKRLIEGEITYSLYESFLEQEADPRLAYALADVFAWQIDFYRVRQGDSFRVLFEERMIDGQSIGLGRIKAADFTHRGTAFNARYFEQDGRGDYFDTDGNSLRKAFLRAPLEFTRISSRFSNNRRHPILNQNRPHHGTDYAAPTGTPIRAVGDGQIIHAAYDRNNGNYIRIRHNGTYETGYLHMSRLAAGMRNGTQVTQGQIIGYVGSTGLSTGPHLCYRFWMNGRPVDPYRIDFPSSEPIKDQFAAGFEEQNAMLTALLDPADEPAPQEETEERPKWHLAVISLEPLVFAM